MADEERLQLAAALEQSALKLQLKLATTQVAQLIQFIDLLSRWNATYNLTAIRGRGEMLSHHIVDCLAAVQPLRRELAAGGFATVLDVGSGAGLPGVVFAVTEPGLQVTCIDSVGKKAAFVQQVATSLQLPNLRARHGRVESLVGPERYDVIVSRAFASLVAFTALTTSLLAPEGLWLAMKGKIPAAEMSALPQNIDVFHVEPLLIPDFSAERCLIWMRRK